MNIDKIDQIINEAKPKRKTNIGGGFGVMGVCLGVETHTRLKAYAHKVDVPMSVIIKTVLIEYLDEKELTPFQKTYKQSKED